MTVELCYNCIYCVGIECEDTIVCDRIWECYVKPKTKCNYFKPLNNGGKL